jgi:hypothetical protein
MSSSKQLRRHFVAALLALLCALAAAGAATFAWYVFNTSAHTTTVRMAAGAGASLQISNALNGTFGSATEMAKFEGSLNPVSTDSISAGFQKVSGFTNGQANQSSIVANLFGASEESDYYSTKLYLRTNAQNVGVYIADISYEDSDAENPISTAIRVGIVPHEAGSGSAVTGEYIFAINTAHQSQAEYNTASGAAGDVLDSRYTNGTTIAFSPYTAENFCSYSSETGEVSLKDNSVRLCVLSGNDEEYGDPVEVDIYIWLEGCDEDCTGSLAQTTLKNLSISFVGLAE